MWWGECLHELVRWGENKQQPDVLATTGDITQWISTILEWKNFEQIISYLEKEFNSWDQEKLKRLSIPSNIDPVEFRDYINSYLFGRFPHVSETSWVDSYKEISFFLFLMSFWFEQDFFEDGDFYNEENFAQLFSVYMAKIVSIEDVNSLEFTSYIKSFSTLCWCLNLICLLSQNDNLRRWFIKNSVDFLQKMIRQLISYLNEKWIKDKKIFNSLTYLLGLLPLNYSHIEYIPFNGKENSSNEEEISSLIQQYEEIMVNVIEWYQKCVDSNYWNNPERREKMIREVFLINLNYILSLLLLKLSWKGIDEDELVSRKDFKWLVGWYLRAIFWENIPKYSTIEELRNICNEVFILCFNEKFDDEKTHIDVSNKNAQHFLDMILSWELEVQNTNQIEILHHIVLFNPDLDPESLIKIWESLFTDSSLNINFEVIRLKIFNIILTRIASSNTYNNKLIKFLECLTSYIDKNKISSHLLFAYSLLYVSIWYCYSFFNDDKSHMQALENYARFRQINPWEFDFSWYWIDIEAFERNIWIYRAIDYEMCWECDISWKCVENDSCWPLSNEIIRRLWKWTLKDFSKSYMQWNITRSLDEFDTFMTSYESEKLDLKMLSKEVSKVLLNIFHGIADIRVIDRSSWENNDIVPNYNDVKEFKLVNGYVLQIIYPKAFSSFYEEFYNSFLASSWDWEKDEWVRWIMDKLVWRLKIFLDHFREENKVNIELVREFELALAEKRVVLNYQPICDSNKKPVKYEVLSRVVWWNKVNWEIPNIKQYLDAVNKLWRSDLLKELIFLIISESERLLSEHPEISLSINLEYTDIIDDKLMNLLKKLKESWINTSSITLELVEWKWPEDSSKAIDNIRKFKKLWYKIAMDDFWAWDSNFNRLVRLLKEWILDYVKLDWEIMKQYSSDNAKLRRSAKAIIENVVELCRIWKVEVIAERIENDEEFMRLVDSWVDYFQWFWLWKPIKEEELLEKK